MVSKKKVIEVPQIPPPENKWQLLKYVVDSMKLMAALNNSLLSESPKPDFPNKNI